MLLLILEPKNKQEHREREGERERETIENTWYTRVSGEKKVAITK